MLLLSLLWARLLDTTPESFHSLRTAKWAETGTAISDPHFTKWGCGMERRDIAQRHTPVSSGAGIWDWAAWPLSPQWGTLSGARTRKDVPSTCKFLRPQTSGLPAPVISQEAKLHPQVLPLSPLTLLNPPPCPRALPGQVVPENRRHRVTRAVKKPQREHRLQVPQGPWPRGMSLCISLRSQLAAPLPMTLIASPPLVLVPRLPLPQTWAGARVHFLLTFWYQAHAACVCPTLCGDEDSELSTKTSFRSFSE